MDMMEIGNGNGNLTIPEERTHFAVWAFMKSPILLGTDVRSFFIYRALRTSLNGIYHEQLATLSRQQIEIITNAELIAFNQDSTVGEPAFPFTPSNSISTDPPQFYSGRSAKGIHVFIVNTNEEPTTFQLDLVDVPGLNSNSAVVRNMWTSVDLGIFSANVDITLAAHDTAALLVTPVPPISVTNQVS